MYYDSPVNRMIPQMIAIALSPRPPLTSILIGQNMSQLEMKHMMMYDIAESVNITVDFFSSLKVYTSMIEKVNQLSVELRHIDYYLTTIHRVH